MFKKKLLIIDPSEAMVELIYNALKDMEEIEVIGYCECVEDGIRIIKEEKPDIITTELNFPNQNEEGGLSGFKILDYILKKSPQTKTLVITNNLEPLIKEKIKPYNINEYLEKPFQPNFIVERVQNILEDLGIFSINKTEQTLLVKKTPISRTIIEADVPSEGDLMISSMRVRLRAPSNCKGLLAEQTLRNRKTKEKKKCPPGGQSEETAHKLVKIAKKETLHKRDIDQKEKNTEIKSLEIEKKKPERKNENIDLIKEDKKDPLPINDGGLKYEPYKEPEKAYEDFEEENDELIFDLDEPQEEIYKEENLDLPEKENLDINHDNLENKEPYEKDQVVFVVPKEEIREEKVEQSKIPEEIHRKIRKNSIGKRQDVKEPKKKIGFEEELNIPNIINKGLEDSKIEKTVSRTKQNQESIEVSIAPPRDFNKPLDFKDLSSVNIDLKEAPILTEEEEEEVAEEEKGIVGSLIKTSEKLNSFFGKIFNKK